VRSPCSHCAPAAARTASHTQHRTHLPPQPSPAGALSDALNNVSITIVGDDSALNQAIAQALGKRIGWFNVQTAKVGAAARIPAAGSRTAWGSDCMCCALQNDPGRPRRLVPGLGCPAQVLAGLHKVDSLRELEEKAGRAAVGERRPSCAGTLRLLAPTHTTRCDAEVYCPVRTAQWSLAQHC